MMSFNLTRDQNMMIYGTVRAERFCDGALLGFFKDGTIKKWLERLKKIQE